MLPDLAGAAEGEDRDQAVDMAWATLVPLVGAGGVSKVLREGVLKEALAAFAARGGAACVERFIAFMDDLPCEVSGQRKAAQLAADMAYQLRGRIAVNPLLNGKGQPLDPGILFGADRPAGPAPRRRAASTRRSSRTAPPTSTAR